MLFIAEIFNRMTILLTKPNWTTNPLSQLHTIEVIVMIDNSLRLTAAIQFSDRVVEMEVVEGYTVMLLEELGYDTLQGTDIYIAALKRVEEELNG